MKFPLRTELIATNVEGVYLRPEYAPKESRLPRTDRALALDILENGFCDKEGKKLDFPKTLGIAQARLVIASFQGALDDLGKSG